MTTFNASNAIHRLNRRFNIEVKDLIYGPYKERTYLRHVIYCIGTFIDQIKYTNTKGSIRFREDLLRFLIKDMCIIKIVNIYAKLKSSTT